MQQQADRWRREGQTIALVPTMGFLHEGHLTLMRRGRALADRLVVSIFVNPTQFGPNEDFDTYPRGLERDLALTRETGVDAVFAPDKARLYGPQYQTYVTLERLPQHLCGLSRPVFLRGVATVVTKLFNSVKPHVAIFGQKDYQQLLVIRRLVQDLNFDIDIIGLPTVREADGLALSSRNCYLTGAQRISALSLFQSLTEAQERLRAGVTDARQIIAGAAERIAALPDTEIDYIAVCDPQTLESLPTIDQPALMALAVKVGGTRLIDNVLLNP